MSATDDIDDDDALAGEFVLGLLGREDEAAARARIAADPGFAARVEVWETRLAPLAESVEAVAPPDHLFAAISQRIAPAAGTPPRGVWASLAFWRMASVSLALCLSIALGALVYERLAAPSGGVEILASLAGAGEGTLIARYDPARAAFTFASTLPPLASGRDHELWAIVEGEAPVSLGVLPPRGLPLAVEARLRPLLRPGVTLAVTDEPLGGSPTGGPTGALVVAGAALGV